jgi:hypothetical protein
MSEVLRNPVSLRNRVSGVYFIQLKTAIFPMPEKLLRNLLADIIGIIRHVL